MNIDDDVRSLGAMSKLLSRVAFAVVAILVGTVLGAIFAVPFAAYALLRYRFARAALTGRPTRMSLWEGLSALPLMVLIAFATGLAVVPGAFHPAFFVVIAVPEGILITRIVKMLSAHRSDRPRSEWLDRDKLKRIGVIVGAPILVAFAAWPVMWIFFVVMIVLVATGVVDLSQREQMLNDEAAVADRLRELGGGR